jgi:hypothetical protein
MANRLNRREEVLQALQTPSIAPDSKPDEKK